MSNSRKFEEETKKRIEDMLNKRMNFCLDKIFQGYIIALGPKETVEEIKNEYNLKIETAILEGSNIEYLFSDGEVHILFFIKKNAKLKKFLINISDGIVDNIDKFVGFSISHQKTCDKNRMIGFRLQNEEFNRDNTRKLLDNVFPSADRILEQIKHESVQEVAEGIFNRIKNINNMDQNDIQNT